MKRKALAIVLTLIMLVGVLPMGAFAAPETDAEVPAEAETKAVTYTDTEGHWAQKSIDRWTEAKNPAGQTVLEGMGNNIFAPDDNLTRAQAMTIFSRLLNLVKTADISKVTDVASDAWYAQWIQKGYAYEIIKGTSDTTFDPDGDISREQFFSIFARAMGIPGADKLAEGKTFTDLDAVSPWFVEEGTVYAMINAGYLNGYPDGSLQPQASITRAEVAQVLANAIDINGYITTDGTYNLKDVTGMVVVLAKNVTLTGAYTGHIVSSCVDSTLYTTQVNPSSVRAAVNVAAKNVKVTNVGVANPPYTPANPYNPNGGNYVYVLQDNTNINPVTTIGGGGTGGNVPTVTKQNYVVKASLTVPFAQKNNTIELIAGPKKTQTLTRTGYTSDQTLQTVLTDLGNDNKDAVKDGIRDAFGKITVEKTKTYGDFTVTVKPVNVESDDGYVEVTMYDNVKNAPVKMSDIVAAESVKYNEAVAEKTRVAGLDGKDGWKGFTGAFDPNNLFTFEDNGNKLVSKTPAQYAEIFCNALVELGKLSAALGDSYDYADNMNKVLGSHWGDYNVFGEGFKSMNDVLRDETDTNPNNNVVLAKSLNVNDGKIITIAETINDTNIVEKVNKLTGRNYVMSPEIQALFTAATTNVGTNISGDYSFTVTVTNNK